MGCFQNRLAFEIMDQVKQITIPNVGGLYPVFGEPE